MTVKDITSVQDFRDAIKSDKPVIIDFYAHHDVSSRGTTYHLDGISTQDGYKKLAFFKVDIDDVPEIKDEAGVEKVPILRLYKDGKQLKEVLIQSPHAAMEVLVQALPLV
ncbi:hypothetical protein VTN00DRAFT_4667 [Thermoascus crustaceus]|uniref:uncharacterized protein n=1 Tax=Thermoascus crustaceus TaxID=5088 RepID=UPI0037432652